ncbi:ABC transporter permease subunit [Cupriavidus basilensis]
MPKSSSFRLLPSCSMLALDIFYRRTVLGRAMRAVAFNRVAAGLMGINVNRITAISFGLAAGLGGAAGFSSDRSSRSLRRWACSSASRASPLRSWQALRVRAA